MFGRKSDNDYYFGNYPYFCTMEKEQSYTHPMNLYQQRINEEGIVVFDDVRGLPSGDEPFTSPDYVICIGHRGRIELMYDDISDFSEQHTVGVIFPNHTLRKVNVTDDYLATLIIVDSSVLGDPLLQIVRQMRYRYEPHPNVKLDKHEYQIITHVVEGMREITRLDLLDRQMLMKRLLEFLLRLLNPDREEAVVLVKRMQEDLEYFRRHAMPDPHRTRDDAPDDEEPEQPADVKDVQ